MKYVIGVLTLALYVPVGFATESLCSEHAVEALAVDGSSLGCLAESMAFIVEYDVELDPSVVRMCQVQAALNGLANEAAGAIAGRLKCIQDQTRLGAGENPDCELYGVGLASFGRETYVGVSHRGHEAHCVPSSLLEKTVRVKSLKR